MNYVITRLFISFVLGICLSGNSWAETTSLLLRSDLLRSDEQHSTAFHDTAQARQPLASYIYYYEDARSSLGIDDILTLPNANWTHNSHAVFNHGYSQSTWWLRVTLANPTPNQIKRLLEISYPVLDYVNLYVYSPQQHEHIALGDKLPFHERPINHRNFVIPLHWHGQEAITLYLSVKSSSSIQVPLTLWQEDAFFNHDRTQTLAHGIYYGIMFVMVVYNLFVYLAVGERNYLYYVLFVCCMPLFLASLSGFAFQYLWPDLTRWNDQAILVTLSGAVLFGALFTHNFLKVNEMNGIASRLGYIFAALSAIIAILALTQPYNVVIQLLIPFASIVCAWGFCMGIWRWFSGGLSAKYYTIAWSALLAGGIVLALSKYDFLPKNLFTDYATQIGSALEVTLLSFALAERINQERKMRFAAQQDALTTERELRLAREQALDIQKQATDLLENRVQERTRELELLNQKLEQLSETDQLTGLHNRRYLDRVLTEEYTRCARYRHALTLVLIDIDHFKQFNDSYGHLIGDDCLREVARTISQSLRWPSDHPTRYGGEEFCVVLPETTATGALQVAERIRSNVEKLEFYVKQTRVPVTVSIGIYCGNPVPGGNYQSALARADAALYQSKAEGRNRVSLHGAEIGAAFTPEQRANGQPPDR